MRVTSLSLFPVKSLGGVDVQRAAVTPLSLEGDRRWVVLDAFGAPVTARQRPVMLGIRAEPTPSGVRLHSLDESYDVQRPGPQAGTTATSLSRVDRLSVADPAAGRWLSERIGQEVVLAHQRIEQHREIGAGHGGLPGEGMSLADAGPLLLVTQASVDRLRD